MSTAHDFDFLLGKDWRVHNRVLRERLVGCQDWDTFEAQLLEVRTTLGGLANTDRFVGIRQGESFEAISFRIFDPNDDEWNIYWLDNRRYRIDHQVRGGFVDGVGELYGADLMGDRMVDLRFRWSELDSPTPLWEQAYRHPETGEWETNWTMRFEAL